MRMVTMEWRTHLRKTQNHGSGAHCSRSTAGGARSSRAACSARAACAATLAGDRSAEPGAPAAMATPATTPLACALRFSASAPAVPGCRVSARL